MNKLTVSNTELLKNSKLDPETSLVLLEKNSGILGSITQLGVKNAILHQIDENNAIKSIEDYTKQRFELLQLGLTPMSIGAMALERPDLVITTMNRLLLVSCEVVGLDSSKINEGLIEMFLLPAIQEKQELNSITMVEFSYACKKMALGQFRTKHYNNFNLSYVLECLNEFAEQRQLLFLQEQYRTHKANVLQENNTKIDYSKLKRAEQDKPVKKISEQQRLNDLEAEKKYLRKGN